MVFFNPKTKKPTKLLYGYMGFLSIAVIYLIFSRLYMTDQQLPVPGPEIISGDFTYRDIRSGIMITNYNGSSPSVNIPAQIDGKTVLLIDSMSFESKQLTSVTIPSSVTYIGHSAFRSNQLTSVTIPNSVTDIGPFAFSSNLLTSVTIPSSVTSIGLFTFNSNQLTSVTIPNSVTSIGSYAFGSNQLTSVTIPSSVTSIATEAFAHNPITNITIEPGNTVFSAIGNFLLSIDEKQLISYLGNERSVTIPNSITSIADSAFFFNLLTSVDIPSSVTSIGNSAFSINQLTSVDIPSSVTSIGNSAFNINLLTSVTIPSSVTSIGDRAFMENRLTSITIGADVTLYESNPDGVFDGNFNQEYEANSRTAGRYVRDNVDSDWRKQ